MLLLCFSVLAEEFMSSPSKYKEEAQKNTEATANTKMHDMEKVNIIVFLSHRLPLCQAYLQTFGDEYSALYFNLACMCSFHLWKQQCECLTLLNVFQKLLGSDPQTSFVPPHLICPLTKKMFVEPVKTTYGTAYERGAIENYLKE